MKNPFKQESTQYADWEKLKDLKWHCTKCELESAQAKTWQVWRQKGIQLEKDESGNYYKKIQCPTCQKKTVHRKLKSLEIIENSSYERQGLSSGLRKKILKQYDCIEAMLLRKLEPNLLEIDHKFPQIRWDNNEQKFDDLNEEEIKDKFILLTRANNLLKSRYCEKCFKTGERGVFPGINFWYAGNDMWSGNPHDEKGCVGCFWNDPFKWRKELNKALKSMKKNRQC